MAAQVGNLFRGTDDPANDYTVQSGDVWIDTTELSGGPQAGVASMVTKLRNAANDGWVTAPLLAVVSGQIVAYAVAAEDGSVELGGGAYASLRIDPDGALVYAGPGVSLVLAADGTVNISSNVTGAQVQFNADGEVTLGASTAFGGDGSVRFGALPDYDPAVAGILWNDAGTVKVSAG